MNPDSILELHRRLTEVYGMPARDSRYDPLSELVSTILSQNTNDRNRDLAFNRLRAHFPTWEEVRDGAEAEVIEAIRPAGLAPSKGPRIQAALRHITEERGELSLAFLQTLPLEEARAWLTALHGVGPKTAAIVLLFSLGRPAFPVDTHIHRVARRRGLIPLAATREKAHELLERLVPPELYYPFHIQLIEHGRAVCLARRPHCERCTLQELCDHYEKEVKPYGRQTG